MTELENALAARTIAKAAERRTTGTNPTNRASAVDWPCPSGARYGVLLRTNPMPLVEPVTQLVFEEGDAHEKLAARRLEDDGWEISNPLQKTLSWPKFQLSGHLDRLGRLPADVAEAFGLDPSTVYPLEIKSMSPAIWERINSLDDLMSARQPWLRGYVGQLLLYLWLQEEAAGWFVLKNKVTGELKFLLLRMEEWVDKAEILLGRCAEINSHVAAGTCPEVMGYEEAVCSKCSMRSICLPGEAADGAIPLMEGELEEQLARREELRPLRDEYEELDEAVKSRVKRAVEGDGVAVCGDWEMVVKSRTVNYKAKDASTAVQRIVTLRRLGGGA